MAPDPSTPLIADSRKTGSCAQMHQSAEHADLKVSLAQEHRDDRDRYTAAETESVLMCCPCVDSRCSREPRFGEGPT